MNRLAKWSSRPSPEEPPLSIGVLKIDPWQPNRDSIIGDLPPSKSHLIRWLLLAAQGPVGKECRIEGVENAGDDVLAMRRAIEKLGVQIFDQKDVWIVVGVGTDGFQAPATILHCENSATAMRLLTIAVSRLGEAVMIDGDASLRNRGVPAYFESLTSIGIDVSHGIDEETLPILVKGPATPGTIQLDARRTSQHLSALLLSMPSMKGPIVLEMEDDLVSRRHAELSFSLASLCGSSNSIENQTLEPFECLPPPVVIVPKDASHVAFTKLLETLHSIVVTLPEINPSDAIGAELLAGLDLTTNCEVNLCEANDLITPLAAAMAISGGGKITGAGHARHKESNRISKTVELLQTFGIIVEESEDGLVIKGGQLPHSPSGIVSTHGDHRLQMTAIILATKVGASIEGIYLHKVSDPTFVNRLMDAGVQIESKRVRNQP